MSLVPERTFQLAAFAMGLEPVLTNALARRTLRRLELEAYSSVVSAFRAQGALTPEKKIHLELLCKHLGISSERHRAEVRRAVNDELLSSVAGCLSGAPTEIAWRKEGQKLASTNPRFVSRQVTHLPQVITSAIVSSTLGLSAQGDVDVRKNSSPQLQQALKFIISQNPINASKASSGGVAGGRGSQEPTPPTASKAQPKAPSVVEPKAATATTTTVSKNDQQPPLKVEASPASQEVTHGSSPDSKEGKPIERSPKATLGAGSLNEEEGGSSGKEAETEVKGQPEVQLDKPKEKEDSKSVQVSHPAEEKSEEKTVTGGQPLSTQGSVRNLPTTTSTTVKAVPSVAMETTPSSSVQGETSIVKAMLSKPISATPRAVSPKATGVVATAPTLPKPPVVCAPPTSSSVSVTIATKDSQTHFPLPGKRPLPPDSLPPPMTKKPFLTPSSSLPPSHIPSPPALTPIVPPKATVTPPTSTPHTVTPSPTPTKPRSPPLLILASSVLTDESTLPSARAQSEESMESSPSSEKEDVPSEVATSISSPPSSVVASVSVGTATTSPPPTIPQLPETVKEAVELSIPAASTQPLSAADDTQQRSPMTAIGTVAQPPLEVPMVFSTGQTLEHESLMSLSPPSSLTDDASKFIQALCSEATIQESTISALASQLGLDVVDSALLGISPDIMQLVEPSTPNLEERGGAAVQPATVGDGGVSTDRLTAHSSELTLSSEAILKSPHPPLAHPSSMAPTQLSSPASILNTQLDHPPNPEPLPSGSLASLPSGVDLATPLPPGITSAPPMPQQGVLSELGLSESELLEGIPLELVETIQAIARLDEQTSLNSPYHMQ